MGRGVHDGLEDVILGGRWQGWCAVRLLGSDDDPEIADDARTLWSTAKVAHTEVKPGDRRSA